MGVKIRYHNGAWWVFINHHSRRKSKRVGDREAAKLVAKTIEERLAKADFHLPADTSESLKGVRRHVDRIRGDDAEGKHAEVLSRQSRKPDLPRTRASG